MFPCSLHDIQCSLLRALGQLLNDWKCGWTDILLGKAAEQIWQIIKEAVLRKQELFSLFITQPTNVLFGRRGLEKQNFSHCKQKLGS